MKPCRAMTDVFAMMLEGLYRKKYDAAKTLATFAATVRDEADLDKLTARLVDVVEEPMQPAQVSLWLKEKANPKLESWGKDQR